MSYRIVFFFALCFFIPSLLFAQEKQILKGKVIDPDEGPVVHANVRLKYSTKGTVTGEQGMFQLAFPSAMAAMDTLIVSHVGYQTKTVAIPEIDLERVLFIRLLKSTEEVEQVEIRGIRNRDPDMIRIDKKDFEMLPTATGEVESIIKNMPGVSSRNELSYQYSVRGGSYDENLVYVNGIEIYRPLIVRSGKQEGLSFLNSDMVSSLNFSAGGFQARYGDKMASVLDIRYSKPQRFSGDMEMSLLGGAVHLEDKVGERFTYNAGFRYKTNQYLLNSLDVKGDYEPAFYDLQTYLTYQLSEDLNLEFLGNYNLNQYKFIPRSRETSFGTVRNALNLKIFYEGQEVDDFENYMGALAANFHPTANLNLRFISSAYSTLESVTFDILGQYYLNELDKAIDSPTYGDSIMNIGVGGYLEHARNQLSGDVYTFSHKGIWKYNAHIFRWGLKYSREQIRDESNEWTYIDSAGYSVPYSSVAVNLYDVLKADHSIASSRITSYFQDTYQYSTDYGDWYFNAGMRAHYWSFNQEMVFSPRISLKLDPYFNNRLRFHFAGGYYYQPPFYKEMKTNTGAINPDIQAQKSLHFVLGSEYDFTAWGRVFKYRAELYYKVLDRLIPYKMDNVRIKYAGRNMAEGYATGLDMQVNGEFVEGVESWASLSLLQTKADIQGDSYVNRDGEVVNPGYYPRPTNQLMNFSMFFQDYVPNHPSYKLQLSAHYGSRLPFSPPNINRYDKVFWMPSYRRVDIGFSKLIKGSKEQFDAGNPLHYIQSLWIGIEVFNLLDINNTISYQWIKTVSNQQGKAGQYAVPNYLTSRRLNLKLVLNL